LANAIRIKNPDSLLKTSTSGASIITIPKFISRTPRSFGKVTKEEIWLRETQPENFGRDSLSLTRFICDLVLPYQGRHFIDGSPSSHPSSAPLSIPSMPSMGKLSFRRAAEELASAERPDKSG